MWLTALPWPCCAMRSTSTHGATGRVWTCGCWIVVRSRATRPYSAMMPRCRREGGSRCCRRSVEAEVERHACEIRDVADAVLDPAAALGSVSRPRFGGIALFVGQVRDSNHGRAVVALEYDIFEPLAPSVFSRIADATSAAYGRYH